MERSEISEHSEWLADARLRLECCVSSAAGLAMREQRRGGYRGESENSTMSLVDDL